MFRLAKVTSVIALFCTAAIVGLRTAFPLPEAAERVEPTAIEAQRNTTLARSLAPAISAHPGLSGILPLDSGLDAFAARVLLTRAAEATIDAQYYIWENDLTGIRLLTELHDAANRGVIVRLLVDDNGTPRLDRELAALDSLPTAEVRLFNPFTLRSVRGLNYVFDLIRLNRRMHNKSFTVDGTVTIIGGRNVGDLYFEAAEHTFLDLDVLAVGPAAGDVEADFERYWRSSLAFPVSALVGMPESPETLLPDRDASLRATPQATRYSQAVRASSLVTDLENMTLDLDWVRTILFSDDPAKAEGLADPEDFMIRQIMAEIGTPETSFDLISAYFVPGDALARRLVDFAASGVKVRVLTNALESTDVVAVHAGYMNYRRDLLEGDVGLFELRSDTGTGRTGVEPGLLSISKAVLHAKSFAIDGRRAFIGSMNFDPRSKRLNTEMGFLIDSPDLAVAVSRWMDDNLARLSYTLTLDPEGRIVWTEKIEGEPPAAYITDPKTTLVLRIYVGLLSLLPLQSLL